MCKPAGYLVDIDGTFAAVSTKKKLIFTYNVQTCWPSGRHSWHLHSCFLHEIKMIPSRLLCVCDTPTTLTHTLLVYPREGLADGAAVGRGGQKMSESTYLIIKKREVLIWVFASSIDFSAFLEIRIQVPILVSSVQFEVLERCLHMCQKRPNITVKET